MDKLLSLVVILFIFTLGMMGMMFILYVGLSFLSIFIDTHIYQNYLFNLSKWTSLLLTTSSSLLVVFTYVEKHTYSKES